MAGPPGDMSQGGPGEAQAMAFFEKVVTAYSAVHGPIDPASPPDIEVLAPVILFDFTNIFNN